MHQGIYEELKRVAKEQRLTNYADIAPLAGLSMDDPTDRNRIADILGEISRFEHEQGRPMLSAVVILRDENIPGQGFFSLAKELGLYSAGDNFMFFVNELRRVHAEWSRSP